MKITTTTNDTKIEALKSSNVTNPGNKIEEESTFKINNVIQRLKSLREEVSRLTEKMSDFQNSSLKLANGLDSIQQEKDRVSMVEQMQINQNVTLMHLDALHQKILSNSRTQWKPQFGDEITKFMKIILKNQQKILLAIGLSNKDEKLETSTSSELSSI